jgi:hypothetical protein
MASQAISNFSKDLNKKSWKRSFYVRCTPISDAFSSH